MKKSIVSVLFIILFITVTVAQVPKNCIRVNSGEIIPKAIKLMDDDKLEESEQLLLSVPFDDTLYTWAQYELALLYYDQEKYEKTLELLTANGTNSSAGFNLLGNTYSDLNQYQKAFDTYDEGLKIYKYNNQLYFNKGIVYLKTEEKEKAVACFKKAILCNPLHQGSHFQLGMTYLSQGYTIPGILALNYTVMLNPSSNYAIQALIKLDEIYGKGIKQYNADIKISDEINKKNERFNKLMMYVDSKIAINKSFKSKSKINHILVKQNQLVFENIEPDFNSHEIVDKLYIPYFKTVLDKKTYNIFSYYLLKNTNINNNKVSAEAAKMGKEHKQLAADFLNFLKPVMAKGIGLENKENITYEYDDNYVLAYFGKYESENNGTEKNRTGLWTFLYNSGNINTEAHYVDNKLTGTYTQYQYGDVINKYELKEGKINGVAYSYFPESTDNTILPEVIVEYENDTINGNKKIFNRSRVLLEDAVLKGNYYEGEVKFYDEQGRIKEISEYKAGINRGNYITYYANGNMKSKIYFGEKDEPGNVAFYYPDGTLQMIGNSKNEQLVGKTTNYFINGNIKSETEYNDSGMKEGRSVNYYYNGQKSMDFNYSNGKLNGESSQYNRSGKPFLKEVYKNDILTGVYLYNTDGSEKEYITPKGKKISFDIYDEEGFLYKTITYQNVETKDKTEKVYFTNGRLSSENHYMDDQFEGKQYSYYQNGQLSSCSEYHHDMLNGLSMSYYSDGKIYFERYYMEDQPNGAIYYYFPNEKIQRMVVFNKGIKQSDAVFNINGEKYSETKYKNGLIYTLAFYNEKGEIFKTDTIENGNGMLRGYFLNGKKSGEAKIIAGMSCDTAVWYDSDGKILNKEVYLNDNIEGISTSFYPFGRLYTKGNYVLGNLHGEKISYYQNGKISNVTNYENGELNGNSVGYFSDGDIFHVLKYEENMLEGISTYYAHDSVPALKIKYLYGRAVTYSYMDKNMKMTEFKPFPKDKIQITSYYPNGKKSMELDYENGMKNGKQIIYYPNGKISDEKNFLNNVYDGAVISYYENGKIQSVANYKNDLLQGKYEEFYDSGKPFYEANYYFDELNGVVNLFDKSGLLLNSANYYYGYIIK
jgi:uncharacterized protein